MEFAEQFIRDMQAVNHAMAAGEAENAVQWLRQALDEVIRLRCDPHVGPELTKHEGPLLSALTSLQFICTDIRVSQDDTGKVVPFAKPCAASAALGKILEGK